MVGSEFLRCKIYYLVIHLNGYQQNGVQWAQKVIKIGPTPPKNNIHVIKIPHLHTEQKLDKLMHTDDSIGIVSNVTKDLEQFQDKYLYGHHKNANLSSDKRAYKYRHRFGISFNQGLYTTSNVVHRGINWLACAEASGKHFFYFSQLQYNLLFYLLL